MSDLRLGGDCGAPFPPMMPMQAPCKLPRGHEGQHEAEVVYTYGDGIMLGMTLHWRWTVVEEGK